MQLPPPALRPARFTAPIATLFAALFAWSSLNATPADAEPGPARDPCTPYLYREDPPPAPGILESIPYADSLLWRISQPGGGPPSYLFGTLHMDAARLFPLPAPVREAFSAGRLLISEIELSLEVQQEFAINALATEEDPPLVRQLSPEMSQRLKKVLAETFGNPPAMLPLLKTWAVMITILQKLGEAEAGTRTGLFLDKYLQEKLAPAANMPVVGLETGREQADVFNRLSPWGQLQLLQELICNVQLTRIHLAEQLEQYLAGNLRNLAYQALYTTSTAPDPAIAKRFLDLLVHQRNKSMAERLQPFLRKGGAFVAVGALHLPGEGGILDRLVRAGYEVSPIPVRWPTAAAARRQTRLTPERTAFTAPERLVGIEPGPGLQAAPGP